MASVTVRRGDTLWGIAKKQGVSLNALIKANPGIKNPDLIFPGQKVAIPGSRDSFESAPSSKANKTASPTRSGTAPTSGKSPYPNGRIPSSALTDVGGGHKLYGTAAVRYNEMKAAAARAGINLKLTDSYRTYAAQVDLAKRKGLYSQGGLAAKPGTSNHGYGRAVDVNLGASGGSRASQWLQANAAKYGFSTIPREPWHWEFRG